MSGVAARTTALLALLAVAVLAATAAGSVGASPPPTPVCPTCGVQFERTAADAGTQLEVNRSEVDVRVRADGSARWTTRTTLDADSADSLTEARAHELVIAALDDHRLVEPGAPEVRLDGRTITATYTAPGVATTRTGVLLVDVFQHGVTDWWVVNADRFTIHAPSTHRLSNDPGGRTNQTAVTYTGTSQERFPDTSINGETIIAFTPADTTAPGVRADIAIAAYTLPGALAAFVRYATLPTLILSAAVLAYPRLGVESAAPNVDTKQLSALTIGGVATILGALLATGHVWFGVTIASTVLAAGFGILATAVVARYRAPSALPALVEGALAGLLAFAASNAIAIGTTAGFTIDRMLAPTIFAVLLAIPAVALLPLGFADATNSPYSRHLRVALVSSPILLIAARLPADEGVGALFLGVLLAAYALLIGLLGVLPYWIGVRLADTHTPA